LYTNAKEFKYLIARRSLLKLKIEFVILSLVWLHVDAGSHVFKKSIKFPNLHEIEGEPDQEIGLNNK